MQLKVVELLELLNMHLTRAGEIVRTLELHGILIDDANIMHLPHITTEQLTAETESPEVEAFLRTLPGYVPDEGIMPLNTGDVLSNYPGTFVKEVRLNFPAKRMAGALSVKAAVDTVKVTMEKPEPKKTPHAKRVISPEARERIAAAQNKRWQKFRADKLAASATSPAPEHTN